MELDPEDASINGHLGDAYWAAGRKLEATYQWRRALTFNPEPDDAAKLEAKLTNSAGVSGQWHRPARDSTHPDQVRAEHGRADRPMPCRRA